jgi:non-ribosomal peptide synthetase component F
MIVLCRELITLYGSLLRGQPCPLPDLPIQYTDFAVWQRDRLQGEMLSKQLSYWSRAIAGISRLDLPTDYTRPILPGCRNSAQASKYPKALTEQLRGLAQMERTTLFMTLLAAFKTLLYRYTRQFDIAVGCPIANRQYVELEGLIGLLANTLVFRSNLSTNPTFRELLTRVREVALGAYEHQDLPFEKLVAELQPDRDLSRSPLVQVTFQLRNYPGQLVQLSDLTMEPFELNTGIAKFDLSLAMTNEVDGLKVEIEYNPDLFESATIARMFGHFRCLLEGIVAHPDRYISDLPILTDPEGHQVLTK